MTTNVASRKTALIQNYVDKTGALIQALNELQTMKITYDSLPAFVDGDFSAYPWLDASTFSTAVGNIDNLIKRLTDGTSTVAAGTRNTLEAILSAVPR